MHVFSLKVSPPRLKARSWARLEPQPVRAGPLRFGRPSFGRIDSLSDAIETRSGDRRGLVRSRGAVASLAALEA